MSPLVDLDARALAAAIADRSVSCVEVMQACLDRIEAFNPKVNAIVGLQPASGLLKEAEACDLELSRGEARGPLHGFPHAVKDLQPVRGLPFTSGSPLYKNLIAPADSIMVERLRSAGVIFIGKTNTPEFGLGSHTFNPVYGVTRNPYDPSRSAGGSSGGAAAALALGMVPLADGSDYGGSLRNPAGWNNVFGFRPSIGRVPAEGLDVWLASMSVLGPMARTAGDLGLLLSVQAGFDPRAPLSLESPANAFAEAAEEALGGLRIGWLGDFGGEAPCEAGILETCASAFATFRALGCTIEPAQVDHPVEPVWRACLALRAWQTSLALMKPYADPARRRQMKEEAIYEVEAAMGLSAGEILAASVTRTAWTRSVRALFSRYDFLMAPTAQVFPFPVEDRWPRSIAGQAMSSYHEWMKGALLVTLSGCPSLAVPAGFSPEGLPIGVQIIGPNRGEAACLALAGAYERASPWIAARRPGLLV